MSDDNNKKYPALDTIIVSNYILGFLCIFMGIIGIIVALSMKDDIKNVISVLSIIFGVGGAILSFARAEMFKLFIDIANDISAIKENTQTNSKLTVSKDNIIESPIKDWTTVNLDVDKFRNGDSIPEAKTNAEWKMAGKNKLPAWCYYENDSKNGEKYGKLYNWFAVNDPRGLAPVGWHVPNDEEWMGFTDTLGGEKAAIPKKLKSTTGWDDYLLKSGNGTNESGFNGLPGGYRRTDGMFHNVCKFGSWWSSSEYNTDTAWTRDLYYGDGVEFRIVRYKMDGLSVRCVKDDEHLTNK